MSSVFSIVKLDCQAGHLSGLTGKVVKAHESIYHECILRMIDVSPVCAPKGLYPLEPSRSD